MYFKVSFSHEREYLENYRGENNNVSQLFYAFWSVYKHIALNTTFKVGFCLCLYFRADISILKNKLYVLQFYLTPIGLKIPKSIVKKIYR